VDGTDDVEQQTQLNNGTKLDYLACKVILPGHNS
jgi:hypothetical protein